MGNVFSPLSELKDLMCVTYVHLQVLSPSCQS